MNAENSADENVAVKASPGRTSSESKRPTKAEEDTTVKVLPGGPPPPSEGKRVGLKGYTWKLCPGDYLIISVGGGLVMERNGTGCKISTRKK
jgi:hypothetical protein